MLEIVLRSAREEDGDKIVTPATAAISPRKNEKAALCERGSDTAGKMLSDFEMKQMLDPNQDPKNSTPSNKLNAYFNLFEDK